MTEDDPKHAESLDAIEDVEIVGFIYKNLHGLCQAEALDDFVKLTVFFLFLLPSPED